MSEQAPKINPNELSDLVTVDSNGGAHRPDGKFLSNQNLELIAEHQDKIRSGIDELNKVNPADLNDIVAVDNKGKAHRPDGKFLSNQNLELIAEHQDQIRDGLQEFQAQKVDTTKATVAPQDPVNKNSNRDVVKFKEQILENNPEALSKLDVIIDEDAQNKNLSVGQVGAMKQGVLDREDDPLVKADELIDAKGTLGEIEVMPDKQNIFKRMRTKAKELYAKAGFAYASMQQKAMDFLSDKEHEGKYSTRNRVVAGVAGVAAVGLAAVLVQNIGEDGGMSEAARDILEGADGANETGVNGAGSSVEATSLPTTSEYGDVSTNGLTEQFGAGDLPEVNGNKIGALESKGGNIWTDVKDMLSENGNTPTDAQIHEETERILQLNDLSWEDAENLPVGFEFKIS
jgi:hypothetical protein